MDLMCYGKGQYALIIEEYVILGVYIEWFAA